MKTTKKVTINDPIEIAGHTLRELQARAAQLAEMAKAEDAEMADLAFRAHTGDQRAAARAEALTDKAIRRQHEARSLEAAIAEATARVQQARASEAQAQGRKVAKELLKRADAIVEHARVLDDANRIRIDAANAIANELIQMRSLAQGVGAFVPSHDQFTALGSRAEHTAGMQTPFAREFGEHIAPRERRTHSSYAQAWRVAITKAIAAVVGEDQPKQKKAEEAA